MMTATPQPQPAKVTETHRNVRRVIIGLLPSNFAPEAEIKKACELMDQRIADYEAEATNELRAVWSGLEFYVSPYINEDAMQKTRIIAAKYGAPIIVGNIKNVGSNSPNVLRGKSFRMIIQDEIEPGDFKTKAEA